MRFGGSLTLRRPLSWLTVSHLRSWLYAHFLRIYALVALPHLTRLGQSYSNLCHLIYPLVSFHLFRCFFPSPFASSHFPRPLFPFTLATKGMTPCFGRGYLGPRFVTEPYNERGGPVTTTLCEPFSREIPMIGSPPGGACFQSSSSCHTVYWHIYAQQTR